MPGTLAYRVSKINGRIETLPPLPAIVPALNAAVSKPGVSASEIAAVILNDPVVTAKVLRVVNSPFYGSQGKITDITRAVVRLGIVALRNLVIGVCAADALRPVQSSTPIYQKAWEHAVATAAASDLIARRMGYCDPQEAFIAGLLHDIGQLAMIAVDSDVFETRCLRVTESDEGFLSRERRQFGIDHATAGAKLLDCWGLPRVFCEVTESHHETLETFSPMLVQIVALADVLVQHTGYGFDVHSGWAGRGQHAMNIVGMNEDDVLQIAVGLSAHVRDAHRMLTQEDNSVRPMTPPTPLELAWMAGGGEMPSPMISFLLESEGFGCVLPDHSASQQEQHKVPCVLASQRSSLPPDSGPCIILDEKTKARRFVSKQQHCIIPFDFSAFDLRWVRSVLER